MRPAPRPRTSPASLRPPPTSTLPTATMAARASLANTGTITTRNPAHDTRVTAKETSLPYVNRSPNGIWSNGTTLWVTQYLSTQLYAYTLATGARDASKEFTLHASNDSPRGHVVGRHDPVGDGRLQDPGVRLHPGGPGVRGTNKEFTLNSRQRPSRRHLVGRHDHVGAGLERPRACTHTPCRRRAPTRPRSSACTPTTTVGATLVGRQTKWVSDWKDKKVYAYLLAGGARATAREFELHADNGSPRGIWSDGTTLWVADSSVRKVFAYTAYAPPALTATSIARDVGDASPSPTTAARGGTSAPRRAATTPATASPTARRRPASPASPPARPTAYEAYSASGCANAQQFPLARSSFLPRPVRRP